MIDKDTIYTIITEDREYAKMENCEPNAKTLLQASANFLEVLIRFWIDKGEGRR